MHCRINFLSLLFLVITTSLLANKATGAEKCCSPVKSQEIIELPETAIKNLTINAGFGWGIFSGSIYNHNKDYHIKQLIISMIPIHGHGHHHSGHQGTADESRIHTITIDLPPDSKGAISMPLPNEDLHVHGFDWKIIKADGYLSNR
ncbi:MAG: hypothetical protein WAU15_00865 [Nitrosomonas sp.]